VIVDAYHYGDLVGRLPGGLLAQRYGGKRLIGFSLLVASLSTALIPLAARVHFSLVTLLRFIAGSTAVRTTGGARAVRTPTALLISVPVFKPRNLS